MYPRWISSTSIMLLLVFFFNTCLFGVILSCVLYVHKQSEKNTLHTHAGETMELQINAKLVETCNSQFRWEKEWEFEYLGEMFDVVDSRKEGDTWIFFCKHDSREDILKKRADREAKKNQDNRDTQSKKNLKVGSVYFSESISVTNFSPALISFPVIADECADQSASIIPDPPPWII